MTPQECSQRANNGRFTLRDLLMVPMQRVLKYHLLLQVGDVPGSLRGHLGPLRPPGSLKDHLGPPRPLGSLRGHLDPLRREGGRPLGRGPIEGVYLGSLEGPAGVGGDQP